MDEDDPIETPVAMPRAVLLIATLLMGFSGGAMWLTGLFVNMMSTVTLVTADPSDRFASLAFFGVSSAAIVIGYTMIAAAAWMKGSHHYRMPGRRLPGFVALEILDQLIAAVSVGLFVVSAVSLASGEPAYPLLWLFGSTAGFALLALSMRLRTKLGEAWRDELLEGPEGAKPLY